VNSGRLSVPCTYDHSSLNGADDRPGGPVDSRVGSTCKDAPLGDGFLLDQLGNHFVLLAINADVPSSVDVDGINVRSLSLNASDDTSGALVERYLGSERQAVYLIRPDQHVTARWRDYDENALRSAVLKACGKE
jgi:3-(3-hydroxy-phenyl)propionate hydroxylase